MRDIVHKKTTLRRATAEATLRVDPATIAAIRDGGIPKGDPLECSKVAAILAAKNTTQILPYCHNIPIEACQVRYKLSGATIRIEVEVAAIARTGVEMEALTAASVAALNIYDMCKMLDDAMEIVGVRLLKKMGGKSDFRSALPDAASPRHRAAVLIASDTLAERAGEDRSGPLLVERLLAEGFKIGEPAIVSDDPDGIRAAMLNYCDTERVDLLLTCGGTGLGPRDHTADITRELVEREATGLAEAVRAYGQDRLPTAMLSRATAGLRGGTLIVNLPGSPGGVRDALEALFPALNHAMRVIHGPGGWTTHSGPDEP